MIPDYGDEQIFAALDQTGRNPRKRRHDKGREGR